MAETSIEWTRGDDGTPGKVWNPVRGCSLVSAGCKNCYAMKQAHRFSGIGQPYMGLTEQGPNGPRWTGVITWHEDKLREPLVWKRPLRIFVNSMSDLFHEDVPDEFIAAVFGVMRDCPQHIFQVLTKRPERMLDWLRRAERMEIPAADGRAFECDEWPLPNVWLGVSVENQEAADERIPLLLQTPAAVRWLSMEPLLGPVDLSNVCPPGFPLDRFDVLRGLYRGGLDAPRVDWVVVGGESGPGARPCAIEWIQSIVDQCRAAGVPPFVKQMGAFVVSEQRKVDPSVAAEMQCHPDGWAWRAGLTDKKGADVKQFPEYLKIREFPKVK